MKTLRLLLFMLLMGLVLGMAQPAVAAPPGFPDLDDEVCFGGSRTIRDGMELNGSLVSFGCSIVVEDGAAVNGDVIVFGGTISIDGEVTGELVAMGAAVSLNENALVLGDLIAPGSSIFREDGSEVAGQVITDSGPVRIDIPDIPNIPDITIAPQPQPQSFFERSANVAIQQVTSALLRLFQTFAFSALAVLLIIFIPRHTERIADAVIAQPVVAGGVGLLTAILAPITLVLLTLLTVFLLTPVTAFGALVLGLALIFGWIAIGLDVGRRLAEGLGQSWAPPLQAGIGTFILTLAIAAMGILPPIGFLGGIIVGSLGLGGVILTRFGTREYLGHITIPQTAESEKEANSEAQPKPKPRSQRKTKNDG